MILKSRQHLFFGFYIALSLLILSSCDKLRRKDTTGNAIARAFDQYLYDSEIEGIVPTGVTSEDSIQIVTDYIDNWVRRMVVLNKAEKNLPDASKNVEKQLLDYRNSLITYAYEQELIKQKLDTVIAENEIEEYYTANQNSFELKDNIIKVLYLKLDSNSPKMDKVKQWYRSSSDKDRKLMEDYAYQYAINYYFDDDTWLFFDDLLKEVPLDLYDKEQFLKNNRFIELKDSSFTYLINIKGFRVKSSLSPLSFEKENIRNMILNQRKLKLIANMEKKAFDDALKNEDFEILINKK